MSDSFVSCLGPLWDGQIYPNIIKYLHWESLRYFRDRQTTALRDVGRFEACRMWLRLCACVVPAAGWSLAGLLFAHSTGFGHFWTSLDEGCHMLLWKEPSSRVTCAILCRSRLLVNWTLELLLVRITERIAVISKSWRSNFQCLAWPGKAMESEESVHQVQRVRWEDTCCILCFLMISLVIGQTHII